MVALKNGSIKFSQFSNSIWFYGCIGLLFGVIFWLAYELIAQFNINSLVTIPLSLMVLVISGVFLLNMFKQCSVYFIMLFICAVFAIISELLISLSIPLCLFFSCLVGIIAYCLIIIILKINRISFSVILALLLIILLYLITKC